MAPYVKLTLVALALLAPGAAWSKKPAPPPPPPPVEQGPKALTPEEKAALFKPSDDALKAGQKTQAADLLLPILDDPTKVSAHGEAWGRMGDLLVGFDMGYSALIAYTRAIEADPVVGATKVMAALELADKVGDNRVIAPILAKNVGMPVDDTTRSRVALLAARHYVQESEYGIASGVLVLVKKDSPSYLEAEALRGVMLANQGRYNDALAPLLTAQALGKKAEKGERFDNMVSLNVARSYYGAGNFPRAVEYYAKIERGSDFWVEAWFEKAWSHFRADDMNGTLSTLMSHESPFLRDWYEPEADLLRAYAYFLMCKFKDATVEITAFEERYRPIFGTISATMAGYTNADGWNDFLALTEGKDTKLYRPLIVDYALDERMLGAKGAVEKANEELDRLANVSANAFATRATETLKARKAAIQDEEGARMLAKGIEARDELKRLLANIQITRLDMMQFETTQLERQSVTGVVEVGDRIGQLRKLKNKPGMLAWPWQGEYWADEVGYYQVLARPDCPDSLRPKQN